MLEKYFKKLNHFPLLPDYYIQQGLSCNFKYIESPSRLFIGPSTFDKTNFVKKMIEIFGQAASSFRLNPPNSLYDWHIDNKRNCSLIWPIKHNFESQTFYKTPMESTGSDDKTLFYNLIEADYELYKPTLLNTTHKHCVVNNSNESRIILSLSLFNTDYENALNILENLTFEDY
jgi:hypothetical protein